MLGTETVQICTDITKLLYEILDSYVPLKTLLHQPFDRHIQC